MRGAHEHEKILLYGCCFMGAALLMLLYGCCFMRCFINAGGWRLASKGRGKMRWVQSRGGGAWASKMRWVSIKGRWCVSYPSLSHALSVSLPFLFAKLQRAEGQVAFIGIWHPKEEGRSVRKT